MAKSNKTAKVKSVPTMPLESNKNFNDFMASDKEIQSTNHYFLYRLALFVFLIVFLGYFLIVKETTYGKDWLVIFILERLDMFGVDDAYRYFSSKSAFSNSDLYHWNYILPIPLFLDGMLSFIFNDNLFLMRCSHVLSAFITLWLIYKSGLALSIDKTIMIFAVLILACMPLYAFVFFSFFGEGWLTLFFSAAIYAYVRRQLLLSVVLMSVMPLIRPEGLFLMSFLGIYLLKEKNIKYCCLLVFPGLVYFIYLLFTVKGLEDYLIWRQVLRELLNLSGMTDGFDNNILSSFNMFWTAPALLAIFISGFRKFWPIWGGVFVWILWLSVNIYSHNTNYEARYLLSVLPVVVIAWAYFFDYWLIKKDFSSSKQGLFFIFYLLTIFTCAEHLLQIDYLRAKYGFGQRWPISGVKPLVNNYGYVDMSAPKKVADEIYELVKLYPTIDAVVISTPQIFYFLDPSKIPKNVLVSYSGDKEYVTLNLLKGYFFALHPQGSSYTIYRFKTVADENRRAVLYVGNLTCDMCKPVFKYDEHYKIYLFWYDVASLAELKHQIDLVGR